MVKYDPRTPTRVDLMQVYLSVFSIVKVLFACGLVCAPTGFEYYILPALPQRYISSHRRSFRDKSVFLIMMLVLTV